MYRSRSRVLAQVFSFLFTPKLIKGVIYSVGIHHGTFGGASFPIGSQVENRRRDTWHRRAEGTGHPAAEGLGTLRGVFTSATVRSWCRRTRAHLLLGPWCGSALLAGHSPSLSCAGGENTPDISEQSHWAWGPSEFTELVCPFSCLASCFYRGIVSRALYHITLVISSAEELLFMAFIASSS